MKISNFKINYPRLWTAISIAVPGIMAAILLRVPYWGDEEHFIGVIRFFGKTAWADAIKDYPEVTTPLVYLLYAAWGHLFGFGVAALRFFSMWVAFAALMVLYRFSDGFLKNKKTAFYVCLSLLVNPYLLGMSVFVFTDMLTLFFVSASLTMFMKGRNAISAVAISAAILCRQYAIVFWLAIFLAVLHDALEPARRRESFRMLLYLSAGLLPLLFLMHEWGGITPPSGARKWIIASSTPWQPQAFMAYMAFSFLYLLPMLPLLREKLFQRAGFLIPALLAGCSYFIFGIFPAPVARIQAGVSTVGLLHRFIRFVTGGGIIEHGILYLGLSLGFWLFILVIRDDIRLFRRGSDRGCFLLSCCCYLFMLIMPFSYQIWEKYLLLVLPALAVRLSLLDSEFAVEPGHETAGLRRLN